MPRPLWRLVLAVGLLLPLFLPGGPAHAAPPSPLVIGADADPSTYANKWSALFFVEAFRRMGIPIQIVYYPLARRTALVDSGEIDIDAGRVRAYGDTRPNLVRVEEPFVEYNFALFTANPTLHLQSLEALRATEWLVEYRRGILFCEKTLKALLPDFKNATRVRKALSLGTIPIYMYLQSRHAELAPRLVATFKKMKAEGLVELYQAQVAQEMGMPR